MNAKIKLYQTIGNAYLTYAKELSEETPKISGATPSELPPPLKVEPKKAEPKADAKKKPDAVENRTFFTKAEPAKTKAELELFKKHWSAMSADQQNAFLKGEVASNIASLQTAIDANATEKKAPRKKAVEVVEELEELSDVESDDLDGIDDLSGIEEKTYTLDEVREAARACAGRIGKDQTYQILENFGSKKVAEIDPSNFAELMQELQG